MQDHDDFSLADPSHFDSGLALNFVHKRIGRGVGGFLTGGLVGAAQGFFSGGESAAGAAAAADRAAGVRGLNGACGAGMALNSQGVCVSTALLGPSRRPPFQVGPIGIDPLAVLPGGDPFLTLAAPPQEVATGQGVAVIGAFGQPAMLPMQVGVVMDHHGQPQPIRRCDRGLVLGKDNLCYAKISNKDRKWPKAARPPVTAEDAKCIRRAAAATSRVKRLAKSVGLQTKKR